MTNSPVTDPSATPVSKPVKTQGPIRHGAVVPVAILAIICFVLFKFFLDYGIKKTLAFTGGYIYGAQVDVGSVHTSILGGTFKVSRIQVTDKQMPSRNLLEIGEIRFGFLWDALLRLKFVVADAGIDGIKVYSPRASDGWVKPPEPPKPADNSKSSLDDIQNNVMSQLTGDSKTDSLGGLAKLLQGTDQGALLKNLHGGLKSEAKIKELQAQLTDKQKAWKDRIDKLPQKKDFDALITRAKTLKFDTSDPKQFAEDIKSAGEIKKEADKKFAEVKDTTNALKTDINSFNSQYKEIDQLVKQDVADAQSKLNIGDMDTKALTRTLFMNFLAQKLGSYAKYLALAQQYMPAGNKGDANKSTQEAKSDLIPHSRSKGRNIHYPITTGYPLFWLKHASISSKATEGGLSGNISGKLENVTTSPSVIGKPAVLDVQGDFPDAQVYKTHLNVTLDHVSTPLDTMEISVGSFPVSGMSLVDSGDMHLGLKTASGDSLMRAAYQNSEIQFQMKNEFKDVKYALDSGSTQVKDILGGILAGIPLVTLDANVSGPLTHLNVGMNSNLGDELANGLKKYVQKQIDDVRNKIQSQIDSQIDGPKKQLTDQMSQATGQVNQSLNTENKEVNDAQKDVNSQSKKQGGSATDALKQKGQELLKGLHF